MIMNTNEVNDRLSSPDNLINRLGLLTGRIQPGKADISTFTGESHRENVKVPEIMSMPTPEGVPSIDDLMDNVENKLNQNLAKKGALGVLVNSITELNSRLSEVDKPESLSKIAKEMSSVVNSLNEAEAEKSVRTQAQIIIWKPMVIEQTNYEVIVANE